jgi:hypothetical protein
MGTRPPRGKGFATVGVMVGTSRCDVPARVQRAERNEGARANRERVRR